MIDICLDLVWKFLYLLIGTKTSTKKDKKIKRQYKYRDDKYLSLCDLEVAIFIGQGGHSGSACMHP